MSLEMSKELNFAARIRSMKVGESFIVKTEKERVSVCRISKTLRSAGVIDFEVVTRANEKGFKVAAI